MDKKKILKNIAVAFFAQGLSMTISAVQSLLIPKVLGVQQFGYWQLFLFYVGYVGFFHFGLSSGVYLEMGGLSRDVIDKESVKSQFLFGIVFQTVIALAIALVCSQVVADVDRRFVIIQTCVVLVTANASTFLMNVLQCMNETQKSSFSTIVNRMSFFLPLLALILMHAQSYKPYIVFYVVACYVQTAYCMWHLRDFATAKTFKLAKATKLSIHSMSIGISLMLANIASMLILGIGRFFIDATWGIESFGKLSLMISLVSFFLAFVNQAGLVFFPVLRQSSDEQVKMFFTVARDGLALMLPMVYLLYFPMRMLLVRWLPAYSDSLEYLALLLPICVFDSKMTITGSTYYNVLRKERVMLLVNAGSTLASLIFVLIGVYALNSITAVIVGMSTVIVLRSIVTEWYLTKELDLKSSFISLFEILLTVFFIITTIVWSPSLAFVAYLCVYVAYLFLHNKKIASVVRALRP